MGGRSRELAACCLTCLPHSTGTAGDSTGTVHLLSLASPAAAALVSSQRLHDADVTSLSFAAGSGGAPLLLAAGSRRGAVKVLQQEPDGLALLASLADHKAAVTGVLLASGGAALHTAGADGRRLAYSWDPAAGRMQLSAQAAVPRGTFVGLAPALDGQAAVAASRAGRLYWDAAGREVSAAALQKTQGEAQGRARGVERHCNSTKSEREGMPFHRPALAPLHCPAGELAACAVDPSLSLLVCATSRDQLLALSLAGGKAAPLAACKAAHTAGSAVTKVGCMEAARAVERCWAAPTPILSSLAPPNPARRCSSAQTCAG